MLCQGSPVQPRWLLSGRESCQAQLGQAPAGQLCGTAAIVAQNSFLITHLSSQFNRKYSSWGFLFLHLKETRKMKLIFSSFVESVAGSHFI